MREPDYHEPEDFHLMPGDAAERLPASSLRREQTLLAAEAFRESDGTCMFCGEASVHAAVMDSWNSEQVVAWLRVLPDGTERTCWERRPQELESQP